MTTITFTDNKLFANHIITAKGGRRWLLSENKRHNGYNYGAGHAEFVLRITDVVMRVVDQDNLDRTYWEAAYGLSWGVSTGRLAPIIIASLSEMDTRQLLNFVYQISVDCANIGDVPRYVIGWYQAKQAA
jgi:hypothetical protein